MIIVKLMGGLGNQLFQYAAGRYLSELYHTELRLDLSFLKQDAKGAHTQRHFALDVFAIKAQEARPEEIEPFLRYRDNRFLRVLGRKLPIIFSRVYVHEAAPRYQKEFLSYPENTYLDGFWQCEQYFLPIADLLRKELTPLASPSEENKQWLERMAQSPSVALHVRRGDYVSNANALSYHGITSLDYYNRAIAILKEKEPHAEFFVFSDDLEWSRKNINTNSPTHFIDTNSSGDSHYWDLVLMQHCRHNITANSSFSWWGAWLNANPNKTVVAPANWYADPAMQSNDIIPHSWKAI